MTASEEKRAKNQLAAKIEEVLGFDLRSLALFRIGLALVVLTDLIIRFGDLTAHYSDVGVLPRTALDRILPSPWHWSFLSISGQPFIQGLIFLLAIFFVLGMLVGYRTRLATIATWAMIISIHNRNPALIFAADDVLRALLFWAMFLPLGACYSIDSALNSSPNPLPKRVVSGATFAFMVQICFIYIWSAAYKTKSELWFPDGDAVYYALSFDQYGTAFGQWLLSLPVELLRLLTLSALWFEWLGPLMIFIPFYNSFFRCVAIVCFILLHISFGLCFELGIFPFLSISSWLVFIPTNIWDALAKKLYTPQRAGLRINYDADCGFCKKVVHFLRTFLILPKTPLLVAQDDPSIYADMQETNSWVVVDWQENRHYKWEAIAYICSLSPVFWFLTPILKWRPLMVVGTKFYETIASNRRTAGVFTRPFKFRPLEIRSSLWLNIVTLFLLVYTSLWNLKSFVEQTVARREEPKNDWVSATDKFFKRRTVQQLDILSRVTRLDQSWSIFAPAPPRDDGWHVIEGKLKDGTTIDVLKGSGSVSWEKPTIGQRNALYRNMQWRTYFINLNRGIGKALYPFYGAYLCRNWNAIHKNSQQLKRIDIYFMSERTVPPGETQTVDKTLPWQQSCSDSSDSK
ncbi:MAG: HTTM domain-containing protein [Hydrococcus sp. C42_A2020_068]|nr:HTTM domain-containing protein [Hydrococcus sp. C42_A2020_068]